ncbi:hypothetical protein [Chlorobium sp. KB01]|nr:hypothetical protein [Chlorobium sp. KB01]
MYSETRLLRWVVLGKEIKDYKDSRDYKDEEEFAGATTRDCSCHFV